MLCTAVCPVCAQQSTPARQMVDNVSFKMCDHISVMGIADWTPPPPRHNRRLALSHLIELTVSCLQGSAVKKPCTQSCAHVEPNTEGINVQKIHSMWFMCPCVHVSLLVQNNDGRSEFGC